MNPLKKLTAYGQSIWLDLLDRELMNSGKLKKLIEEDDLRGLTSNPSIFEKAITGSSDYDAGIEKSAKDNPDPASVFFDLAVSDIRQAADIFKPVFEKTGGKDGFVSLEVTPDLAYKTRETIEQVRYLWKKVNRKNAMIKIPGTGEGIGAIRQCLSEGININITLLFGIPRYREITEAFMGALEDRLKQGKPIKDIASVASFFLSRIDVITDPVLEEKKAKHLKGKIAIASAKTAYAVYQEMISSKRFENLAKHGARPQRLLWASTSTKNPEYSDVLYVENLIGADTINTLPIRTIDAFRDHGKVTASLTKNAEEAGENLAALKKLNIDLDSITRRLEEEGVEKFNTAYKSLLQSIEKKSRL